LPSPIQAVQRTAMTADYAYGYNSRNTLLKRVRLAHAVGAEANTTQRRGRRGGRDIPEPLVSFVEEVLGGWRLQQRRVATSNELRVADIAKHTADTIKEYPRTEHAQHQADQSRERLFNA